MWAIFWIVLFAFLVDGLKILVESSASCGNNEFEADHSQVTVVIPLYNKKEWIAGVLRSAKKLFPEGNIIIADDASTDGSFEIAKKEAPNARFFSFSHVGKVGVIERVLPSVSTKFTLLLDADVILEGDFRCPTSLLDGKVTAAAFNVMPADTDGRDLVYDFQAHEYARSMKVGRRYLGSFGTVTCISGAAGLFITERLRELTEKHSKRWPGEDLERTLLELVHDGRVIFIDEPVKTETPKTFWSLMVQRVVGWWPGLWMNIPLFFRLGIKKNIPVQLRFEMAYQMFSLLLEPLKAISLFLLILHAKWPGLLALYLIYLMFEVVIMKRVGDKELKRPAVVASLYFFYNILQMMLRLCALAVTIWSMAKKNRKFMEKNGIIAILTAFLCFFPNIPCSAKDHSEMISNCQFTLDSNDRKMCRNVVYVSFEDDTYVEIETESEGVERQSPKSVTFGRYFKRGKTVINPEARLRDDDIRIKVTFERPLNKRCVGRVSFAQIIGRENFSVVGVGLDYYYNENDRVSLDVIKEFGREKGVTLVLKNHMQRGRSWIDVGGCVTNLGGSGVFIQIGRGSFFVEVGHYKKYDFEKFDRNYIGIGFKF